MLHNEQNDNGNGLYFYKETVTRVYKDGKKDDQTKMVYYCKMQALYEGQSSYEEYSAESLEELLKQLLTKNHEHETRIFIHPYVPLRLSDWRFDENGDINLGSNRLTRSYLLNEAEKDKVFEWWKNEVMKKYSMANVTYRTKAI